MADQQHQQAWAQTVVWIEKTLGGTVTNARAQGRWRSAMFFDLERQGEKVPLYFRGLRPGMGTSSTLIQREADILRVLERHGLPVPHVHAVCPEPAGIVMDCCPGRPNLATATSQQEREAVLDQYIDALVVMHGIDITEFERIGMKPRQSAEALALGDLAVWEGTYRHHKARPEPAIEFALAWLKANQPAHRSRCVFLHADAGQFIFEQGHITALLDFELSYLGDPAADLAGLRTRDISEPLGDIGHAYRRYQALTGDTIDPALVDYHTVRFALVTPLCVAHVCAKPPPRLNLAQYLSWYLVYTRMALELIAGLEGISLQAPPIPAATHSRQGASWQALQSILEGLRDDSDDNKVLSYELDTAVRLVTQLERADGIGGPLDAQDWQERVSLLGYQPGDWSQSEQALEELVLSAGPERTGDILNYLYRHTVRQLALLGPALRELEHARVQNPTW